MGLGPIFKRHNVFQWDHDAAAAARCVHTLTMRGTQPVKKLHEGHSISAPLRIQVLSSQN